MATIEEDYVSFETAKLLKEKGFDEDCWCWYEDDGYFRESNDDYGFQSNSCHMDYDFICSAPTQAMAMKWLREKGIYVCPKLCCFCGSKKKDIPYYLWEPRIIRLPSNNIIYPQPLDMCKHYENYEEAVEAALKRYLEYLI
jgi:hypothetical protein